jgi:DNA-directed RNA polymerase subunit RPC12/RpoP
MAEVIREEVGKQVGEFTNDYLAANPKEEEKKGSLTDEARSSGIPDEFAYRYTRMLCRNPDCRNTWQMNLKEYYEMVEQFRIENPGLMENPAADCPKCSEPAGYQAVKCEKCGLIFENNTVPRTFEDRCPDCGHSAIEERRKKRAAKQ